MLIKSQEHSVQESQHKHQTEEDHGRIVDIMVQTGEFLFFGQLGIYLHSRILADCNDKSYNLGVRDKTIRPDGIF